MNTTKNTETATITLDGQTREVQVVTYPNGLVFTSRSEFVATIGAGKATYPVEGQIKDGKLVIPTLVRNRRARIVGWADQVGVTNERNNARR